MSSNFLKYRNQIHCVANIRAISITMLTGDNSILKRAVDAKERTERAEIIESAKTDILGQIAENKGENITDEQLKSILNKYFNNVPDTLPDNISELALTSINGNYTINANEIYDGTIISIVLEAGLYNADTNEQIYTWEQLIDPSKYMVNIRDDGFISRDAFNVEGDIKVKLIIDKSVKGIDIMQDISKLKEVIIPDNVTVEIGDTAFAVCNDLDYVYIGKNARIGNSAFACCESLKSINIANGVTAIGNQAFWYSKSLKNINFPNEIQFIGAKAFYECSLEDVIVPAEAIGQFAFSSNNLKEITIGENVISIEENAFTNNPNLESATIKSGSIGNNIFNACEKLKTINIGKGVSSIASNAFASR